MAFRTSALVLVLTAAFSPLAAAQEQDTAVAAPTTATAGQPAKPPTEVERLRAENETLRRQLDRQTLIADNARGQLDRAREEAKLKDELIELGRTRNGELLKLGREILDRYARKDFFALFGDGEPFVQSSRVRLENLVQNYEDKLRAQRFTKDTLPPSVEARMRADLAAPAEAQPAPQPQPNNP